MKMKENSLIKYFVSNARKKRAIKKRYNWLNFLIYCKSIVNIFVKMFVWKSIFNFYLRILHQRWALVGSRGPLVEIFGKINIFSCVVDIYRITEKQLCWKCLKLIFSPMKATRKKNWIERVDKKFRVHRW